jgi:hypothetical protein
MTSIDLTRTLVALFAGAVLVGWVVRWVRE